MGEDASPARAHDGRVRMRARRVWWAEFLGRRGVRSALRLGVIATYSIVFMWGGFFDWAGWAETVLWTLGALLWLVIASMFVRELVTTTSRVRHVLVNPSLLILLVAPAFLWFTWMPLVAFLLVVVAYVLDLRNHSAGDGFLFSFGLVLFVGVFAGLSMVEVEYEDPQSTLDTPADAIFWAFASLLRINYGKAFSPVTDEGRVLATVVGVCAVLCASLFTAQVVKWLVGTKAEAEAEAEAAHTAADDAVRSAGQPASAGRDEAIMTELAAIRTELAALRSRVEAPVAGGGPLPSPPPAGTLER
jgi:voltage-gated potassium channel